MNKNLSSAMKPVNQTSKTLMRPDTNGSILSSNSDHQIEMNKLEDEFIREKAQAAADKLNAP